LFFGEGYGRRSNSVQALQKGRLPLEEKIRHCEGFYAAKNLPTRFKVTPLSEAFGLPDVLSKQGYQAEGETRVNILTSLSHGSPSDDFGVEVRATEQWQGLYQAWNNISYSRGETLGKILKKIPARPFFGLLHEGEKPVACASGVLDGEWVGVYEVTTDPEKRRRGYGRNIVQGVLSWAVSQGARRAYLQVMVANFPALGLYESFGFQEAYRYRYYTHLGALK
jgi:ribosomal protein S18 acetylase RimI-like enzyme